MPAYSTGAKLGASWSGLTGTVGYRLVTSGGSVVSGFTTAGVAETTIPGQYTVAGGIPIPDGFTAGRIVWGTSGTDRAEEFFAGVPLVPPSYPAAARLGAAHTGLAVGYRVLDASGSVVTAFTTAGVTEDTVPGDYLATVTLTAGFTGRVVWGPSGTDLAQEWVNTAPAATFGFSDASVVPQGTPGTPTSFGGQTIVGISPLGTGFRTTVHGTAAALGYLSAATGGLAVVVDGVASTPTLTAGLAPSSLTLFSGLADGPHEVEVVAADNSGNVYLIADTANGSYTLSVTGSAPSLSLPTGYSNSARKVIATDLASGSPKLLLEGMAEVVSQTYPVVNPTYGGVAYRGGSVRWRGTPASLKVFGSPGNLATAFRLTVDGVNLDPVTTGSASDPVLYDWLDAGSGLDAGSVHDYRLMTDSPAHQLYELMLVGGTGFDATAPTPRGVWGVMGNSIPAGSLVHVWESYACILADAAGLEFADAGIPGSTVSTTNGSNPMVGRTASLTRYGSRMRTLLVHGPLNDLLAGTPLATMQADLSTLLATLKSGCPAADCWMMGVLPTGSVDEDTRATWNAATRTTALAAGWRFVDPTDWLASLVPGGDWSVNYNPDRTHPNPAGHALVASLMTAAMPPPPLTAQAPSAFRGVFDAFRSLLIGGGLFSDANCVVSLERRIYPKWPSPFCVIQPGDFRAADAQVSGGGRATTGAAGSFDVYVYVRSAVDTTEEDKLLLLASDATYGVTALADLVKDALHLSFPADADGNLIAEEPPRWVRTGRPERYDGASEWAVCVLTFECVFNDQLAGY